MKNKIISAFLYTAVFFSGWMASQFFTDHAAIAPKNLNDFEKVNKTVASDNESYLKALEELLSEYEGKISKLTDINSLLQSKVSLADSQKSLTNFIPQFRKKIQHMSEEEVKENLYSLFKKKQQLEQVNNYKNFANRFIDLAIEEDELPSNIEDANHLQNVSISISRTSAYSDVSETDFQMSKYYKLYANISASPSLHNVMLKWVNLSNGELIKYQVTSFPSSEIQYVWARPPAGWEVGTYQVSLHNLNDDMSLIARRLYSISAIIDEGAEPVYDGPALIKGN